jgi:uncharacterized protein (TIGR04255 family)
MPHPHLSNAPIVEAMIDLRVDRGLVTAEAYEAFRVAVTAEFPERRDLTEVQFAAQVGALKQEDQAASLPTVTTRHLGHAYWTADHRRVVQARQNGFAFSHLAPYDQWSSLRDEARRWWDKYVEISGAAQVTRCGLRYINRIVLPLPMKDLGDYFLTRPELPEGLKMFSGLFMRLVLPTLEGTAVVTQSIEGTGPIPAGLPILLDIDASRETLIPAGGDEAWAVLEKLAEMKNNVFFQSLTPAALEPYL